MSNVAILETNLMRELLIGGRREYLALEKSQIPFCEIGRGHAQLACAVIPASRFTADRTRRTERESSVGGGIRGAPIGAIACGSHAQRIEAIVAQTRDQGVARKLFA